MTSESSSGVFTGTSNVAMTAGSLNTKVSRAERTLYGPNAELVRHLAIAAQNVEDAQAQALIDNEARFRAALDKLCVDVDAVLRTAAELSIKSSARLP